MKAEEGVEEVAGFFVTYVDDILAVGDPQTLQGFCARVQRQWEAGQPEWISDGGSPVRFLGMEIERHGDVYRIHQQSYLQSILEKYGHEKKGYLSGIKPTSAEVLEAQKQTGELLCVASWEDPT